MLINSDTIIKITEKYGTPVYIYSESGLRDSARQVLQFPNSFGLTARFSMKAASNRNILKIFNEEGLHFDASSGFEADRAILCGISAKKIQITAQELPNNIEKLVTTGCSFIACSLNQLNTFGKLFHKTSLGVRINPGIGSGHSQKTNVGGVSSSFGIWWEYIPQIKKIAEKHNLKITKIHTHIGSGSDPEVWKKVAKMSLEVVKNFPDVEILNLGGGFKVGRMPEEKTTDLHECGVSINKAINEFFNETNRKLHLEIEPGTYLTALNGILAAKVIDRVDTGKNGYSFVKLNTGMTEITRPTLYGALHPLRVIRQNNSPSSEKYETAMVVGHCCESGDILTPEAGNPENLAPRTLPETQINDLIVIEGAGAYCSSMSTKNYNSFPEAPEVLLHDNGTFSLIRKRQSIEQMIINEIPV